MKISQIKKCNTVEDLNELGLGNVTYEIGYRGGHLGFWSRQISEAMNIPMEYLPKGFGAACNYLGGGVRGAIFPSGYNKNIPKAKARILDALSEACIRVYKNLEMDSIDADSDDETSCEYWNKKGTDSARMAGTISAY